MKISDKQAMKLLIIAKDSLSIRVFGHDQQGRLNIVNEIIDQQSDELKELE